MIYALFLSTYALNSVSGASCYITRETLLKQRTCGSQSEVSLVSVTVITLIGLNTFIHLTHSVHNNVGVHSFIY